MVLHPERFELSTPATETGDYTILPKGAWWDISDSNRESTTFSTLQVYQFPSMSHD